jgi:hypothetical protein
VRVRNAAEWTTFVDGIDYDARRQRQRIVYGGGSGGRVTTAYTYDRFTFRLTHLETSRDLDARLLQNLSYTYDPAANITEIRDEAQQTVFFDNAVVTPSAAYEYDAIYRLIQASGREQAGGAADSQPDDRDRRRRTSRTRTTSTRSGSTPSRISTTPSGTSCG